jgi:hypothetical protein
MNNQIDIADDVLAQLIAKAKALIEEHYTEEGGIDVWDAVMTSATDGYDVNVYQLEEDEPIRATVYEVRNLQIVDDYAKWKDITEEVTA